MSTTPNPATPKPMAADSKNWTWVLQRSCPDCGFDAPNVDRTAVGRLTRQNALLWPALLRSPQASRRPTDTQWSAVEYASHVRDTLTIFDGRLSRMLEEEDPEFVNWDQDKSAVDDRDDLQDPAVVERQLLAAAATIADRFDTVTGAQWDRPGLRSDGSRFTVESFARYFLHDPVHHVHDVVEGFKILGDNSP